MSDTQNQAGDAGAATTAAAAAEARKRAAASNFLPIVRGRLPLIFVHAIRFDEVISKMSNKDGAAKFATSVGKVFDIKKGRNFGYVDANFKPTAEDVAAAEGWIAQVGAENAKGLKAVGDTTVMTQVLDQYKARGLATAEEAAAFSAARTSTRKPAEKKEGGEKSPAASTTEAAQGSAANAGDELLS